MLIYLGFKNKSPYFSRSRETLKRIGASGISPIFTNSISEVLNELLHGEHV